MLWNFYLHHAILQINKYTVFYAKIYIIINFLLVLWLMFKGHLLTLAIICSSFLFNGLSHFFFASFTILREWNITCWSLNMKYYNWRWISCVLPFCLFLYFVYIFKSCVLYFVNIGKYEFFWASKPMSSSIHPLICFTRFLLTLSRLWMHHD